MAADWNRRDFIKTLLASLPFAGFDWSLLPRAAAGAAGDDAWDAIVIGSGLGGLACAAAFARQGFRPLVLEQHDRPGGYATTFKRPGGFEFDVSLHSTSVTPHNGAYDRVPGFPEIEGVEFLPHPTLYRAIFPEHDLVVPNRAPEKYVALLKQHFPDETAGIDALFADMQGVVDDIGKISAARGQVDFSRFPIDYPHLFGAYGRTWGQMQDAHLKSPKLKAIVSTLSGATTACPRASSPPSTSPCRPSVTCSKVASTRAASRRPSAMRSCASSRAGAARCCWGRGRNGSWSRTAPPPGWGPPTASNTRARRSSRMPTPTTPSTSCCRTTAPGRSTCHGWMPCGCRCHPSRSSWASRKTW